MRLSLFSLLLLLFLVSCGDTSEANTEDTMDDTEVDTDDSPQATLDATVAAVRSAGGDLTALPANAAVSNIDTWIDQLDDVDGADKVTANLETLKETLTSGNINGTKAGLLLLTLAEDTKQVVGGNGNAATNALVSSLRAGGEKLTASATSGDDLLSQTLNVLKQYGVDITTLPAAAAVGNIDSWIGKLQGMDGTDDMVEELQNLKAAISEPSIDGDKVADILESLADGTEEMAGDNMALQGLAYALHAGHDRLK